MYKKLRLHLWLPGMGLVILLAIAASIALAPAYASHCKGKHKNDPGCGGGDDSNTSMPVTVTFQCPGGVAACDQHVWHDATNFVYTDGQEGVSASISRHGHLNFHTGLRKNKVPTRQFVFDYSNASGSAVPLDPPAGLIGNTSTDIAFNYNTHIQVNRRLTVADLRLMTVGQTLSLDMWADLTVYDGKSGSGIVGRFDATSGNNCPFPAGTAGQDVSVTRTPGPPDKSQWVVTAPAGLKACVTAPFESTPFAEAFDMGGFEMVITEL